MEYREMIEKDEQKQIMEQNISYLNQIAEQMKLGYVSVFTGAGASIESGYVDWNELLKPIYRQMRLNDKEVGFTEIAQYYKNQYGRQHLNDLIFNEFTKLPKDNKNIKWLAKLPIKEYWTTNYDHVIEDVNKEFGKVVETVVSQESFKYHDPKQDIIIYKMHGDKNYPDDVILTKEDYQKYDEKRGIFTKLLSVELVMRTFLFIGFSFKDPNLERILSIAKNSLNSEALPKHYCFMRRIQVKNYLDDEGKLNNDKMKKYIEDRNYQELRINDMRKYGIYTILIDDFSQITLMLKYLYKKYTINNIFISGGINPEETSQYGEFNNQFKNEENQSSRLSPAENFLKLLGKELVDNDFQIYTGFGAGVGNYILSGVLESDKKNLLDTDVNDIGIHINSLIGLDNEQKRKVRERLISQCSSILVLFGDTENLEKSGIYEEYKIAQRNKNFIIPVKPTGFAAEKIYDELKDNELESLNFSKEEKDITKLVNKIIQVLNENRKKEEERLNNELLKSMSNTGVFISYHYNSDNKIAKKITEIVDNNGSSNFTVVKEDRKKNDPKVIKNWIEKEILNTKITILLISKETLERKYVSYELQKSLENRNKILPILMDTIGNKFNKETMDEIEKELNTKFPNQKLQIKKWIEEKGEENILDWLDELMKS